MGRLPLRPGETSIDSVRPYRVEIKGSPSMRIGWSIRMPGEAQSRVYYTTARLGTDVAELRRRAHVKADSLLQDVSAGEGGHRRRWTARSGIAEYLCEVTLRAIEDEPHLRPRSRARYRQLLNIAIEQAGDLSIGSFCVPRALVGMLRSVATTHGTATARQLKRWMGKYVMRQLMMDGAIALDPLRDLEVTLPDVHKGSRRKAASLGGEGGGASGGFAAVSPGPGVRALSPQERARVIEYLLGEGVSPPVAYRGPLTSQQAASFRRTIVDMTLVHATCGLRANECRNLLARDIILQGRVPVIEVRPDVSKTRRGRRVPLFDPVWGREVGKRLAGRVTGRDARWPVFGAARNAGRPIDGRCAAANTRKLYDELADELDIPLLREVSTHVWRATLNTEWQAKGMSPAVCSALFGHSVAVNHDYYTAAFDVELICEVARRGGGEHTGVSQVWQGLSEAHGSEAALL